MEPGLTLSRICRVLVVTACLFTLTVADPEVVQDPGDVMLAAMFPVRANGGDGLCGNYVTSSLISLHAIKWFLRKLNAGNYIPGVTIGLDSRMTCYNPERARSQALGLLESYLFQSNDSMPPLFGVIGPSTTPTAVPVAKLYSSLPKAQRFPLVSGSATGLQLREYSNFFRVIPPDDVQIEVLAALLVELQWNYVAIVYTDDDYGRAAASSLRDRAAQLEICVPFYRSVDQLDGVVMASLAGTPDQNRVAGVIFIGKESDATSFLALLENFKQVNVEIIFSEAVGLRSTALERSANTPYSEARGSMSVTPPYREMVDFRQAWNGLWADCNNLPDTVTNNPWLNAVKGSCPSLPLDGPSLFPWFHVQATAVLAAALKELHTTHCGNAPGSCPEFRAAVRDYGATLDALTSRTWNLSAEFSHLVNGSFDGVDNVSFGADGELKGDNSSSLPQYEVYNFQPCGNHFCFKQVGDYASGRVSLTLGDIRQYDRSGNLRIWPNLTLAQCALGRDCSECRGLDMTDVMLMTPGDFYAVVVAPVHTRDPNDPYLCGKPRGSLGADFVQATLYALDAVNAAGGRWRRAMPGTKLGAIFVDSCYSPPVIKNKLFNLHKGRLKLVSHNGAWLDESEVKAKILPRIAGYLGGFFSSVSLAMSDVLTELDLRAYVHLSPTSVASELSDREKHPYFLRIIEPARTEVLAMLDMLRHLEARYVQIIYNPWDPYTKGLADGFKKHSATYGVCVAQEIDVSLKELSNPSSMIIDKLRQKVSARMVVVILQYEQIVALMKFMNKQLQQQDPFIFMGSDAWAYRPEVVHERRRLAGSITISEEIALDDKFTSYFRAIDPLSSPNVWLKEFWQERKACFLNLSMNRAGRSPCPENYRASYQQDPWIPFYIQALKAFASGVGKALQNTCGAINQDICSSLSSKAMVAELKKVKLNLFGMSEAPVFDSNGDGRIGYYFMQAFWNSSSMQYRRIGKWNMSRLSLYNNRADLEDKLSVRLDDRYRNFRSSCSNSIDCCPSANGESPSKEPSGDDTIPMIPAAISITVLGVLLIVFIVSTVFLCRRHRQLLESMARNVTKMELRFENSGLSNVSLDTSSGVPIQEMYNVSGSSRTDVSPLGTSVQPSDYAAIRDVADIMPPPQRCGTGTMGSDYLTVIDGPKAAFSSASGR